MLLPATLILLALRPELGVGALPAALGDPGGTNDRRERVVPFLPNPVLGPPPFAILRAALFQFLAEGPELLQRPPKRRVTGFQGHGHQILRMRPLEVRTILTCTSWHLSAIRNCDTNNPIDICKNSKEL